MSETTGSTVFEVVAMGGKLVSSRELPKGGGKVADPVRRDEAGSAKIVYWGDDNLYPQQLNTWVEKSTALGKLSLFAQMLASGGIEYGVETKDGFQKAFDQKIQDYNDEINVTQFLADYPIEMMTFNTGFAELIVSKDRSRITNVVGHESMFCRVSRRDRPEMKDKTQKCYISANWDLGDSEDSPFTEERTMIDPYFDRLGQVRDGKEFAYVLRTLGPGSGRVEYSEGHWTSAIKSGWLKYSLSIPEAKNAKIENAMMVMIHIEVPDTYWVAAYPDWEEKKDLQAQRKTETQEKWTKIFTSKENWGKTVMTSYKQYIDGTTGQHILFKVLENPFKNSELIEDSFEASAKIYEAMGIDATLFGTIPGKAMGAGSGSDKEWAWILAMLSYKVMQDLFLAPLQYAYDYNKFGYKLRLANYELARQYMLKLREDKKDPNASNKAK